MSFAIQWSHHYHSGSPELDRQRHQLFRLLRQLDQAITRHQGALPLLIETLITEAINQNASEEAQLRQAGYPDLPAHRQQHQAFEQRLHEQLLALHRGENPLRIARELRTTLTLWISQHVRHADKAWSRCLQRHRNQQKLPKILRQMFSSAG